MKGNRSQLRYSLRAARLASLLSAIITPGEYVHGANQVTNSQLDLPTRAVAEELAPNGVIQSESLRGRSPRMGLGLEDSDMPASAGGVADPSYFEKGKGLFVRKCCNR